MRTIIAHFFQIILIAIGIDQMTAMLVMCFNTWLREAIGAIVVIGEVIMVIIVGMINIGEVIMVIIVGMINIGEVIEPHMTADIILNREAIEAIHFAAVFRTEEVSNLDLLADAADRKGRTKRPSLSS